MSATDLYTVITPTKNILRDRPYVLALMRGVEENPAEFLGLVGSMDTTITDYNRLPESPLPDGLRHLPAIKPLLPEVPLIRPMIQSSNTAACRSFRSVLREISPLMERAEQKQPEPMVGFHIWEGATYEQRLVGGIFQVWGLLVVNRKFEGLPAEERYRKRDSLLDGLIEVMVMNANKHPSDKVRRVVKALGWCEAQAEDGSYVFSETIRDRAEVYA